MKKKSEDKDLGNNELNFDDLYDLENDSGIDFGDDLDTSARKPSVRDIAKELSKEAGKGFLDSVARKSAEKAFPDSYKDNIYAVIDYADFAKEVVDTNKTKIEKSLYKLGKEVKKILPFQSKILENFLSKYEADFEEFKQQSIDQQRDVSIESTLSSLFDKQLDIQKALESKRFAEEQVDKKQRMAVDKISIDVLSSIDSHVATQSAFTLQINKEYYRKSLELQYKTYFIQADMLKDMRDYYKGFSKQLEDISLNTALPEYVKLNKSEAAKQVMQDQLLQSAYRQMFSNSDYVKNVKQKMSNLINEKITNVTDNIDNITEALSGVNQLGEFGGGNKVLGGIISKMAGNVLGEKIAEKIPSKYLERVKNNKTVQIGGNLLTMLANSPRTLFASLRNKITKSKENFQDESSPIRFIVSKLLGGANELLSVTDPDIKNYSINRSSILDHNKPAIFDNKIHRSISEVIPMYLAKILSENANLRQMYKIVNINKLNNFKDSEELVYDYEGRKLSTKSDFKIAIEKSVFKNSNKSNKKIESVANSISYLAIDSAEKSGDKEDVKFLKNKKAQKSFSDFMIAASNKLKPEDYNYENLVTNYEKNSDLETMVKNNPTLARYINILQKNDLSRKHINLNEKVLDTKRVYPILGVIELFKGTSKIIGAKTLNNLKDDVANKIAEGLTRYIFTTNSMITMENIINGQCFRMMTDKDLDICLTNIKIFIGQCKIINASSDYLKETSFEVLLGVMNESLLNNFEVDPEVFQKLYDYSPILQEDGRLSISNLVEGKLGKESENIEFVDDSKLKDLSRTKISTIRDLAQAKTKTTIIEQIEGTNFYKELTKFTDITTDFKTNLNKAESAKEIGASVKKMFVDVIKQSQESSKKFYSTAEREFIEGFNKISKDIENITEKTTPSIKNSMLLTINKIQAKVEILIKTEEESLRVMEAQLEEVRKTLEENIDDPRTLGTSKLSIKASLEGKKTEIKTLKKFKGNLQAAANRINNIDPKEINVNDSLKAALKIFQALKTEAEETLAMFEAESKAQAEAAMT